MKLAAAAVQVSVLALALSAGVSAGRGSEVFPAGALPRGILPMTSQPFDTGRSCNERGSYCDPQVPCCSVQQYWYGGICICS
ncbi:hypothetical protein BC834DRAFT_874830 [Gloeopeniophorella convolvens]|nr:hypothetical protein BC834DRAFT_874830 [Gloeopeniophorella convolvens]